MIEILVAVVLLGIGGVAVLGAMATAARGSSVNKSQAGAIVWLQSAADYMAKTTFQDCTVGAEAAVQAAYNDELHLDVAPRNQNGWDQMLLTVDAPVQFWNGNAFAETCTPTAAIQQISLRVTSPSGAFSHSLVIVKSNG